MKMTTNTKTNMKKRTLSLVLALALAAGLLNGCGKPKTHTQALSPENTTVTTGDGITVDVGGYLLDGETELNVTKRPTEVNKEEGYKIESYDISIGDLHELGDFITIRIPYSADFCEAGQDPDKCVGAKYKNEETGAWEDVLFEVDAESDEIVIYTDHLSCYGVFYVENEGKRNAYITDVLDAGFSMDSATAIGFAERIAAEDPTVTQELAKFGIGLVDKFFDYSDRLDNAITMATVGDIPDWLNTEIAGTNQTLFSAIGYVATCKSLLKVAVDETVGGGADKGEVLNLIRDVSSKVTTYWADAFTSVGSSALSVGMGGVLIIDKMLTAFAEEAASTKMEDIAYVYHHYNEGFKGFGHKPMTSKDWRAKAIEVLDKHPEDPEIVITALEAGFREYASEFFDLTYDQQAEVAADTPLVTVKNIPNITSAEQEKLIDEYIAHLKSDIMPGVLKSVENYMVKKVEQQQISAVNAVKDYYNSKISITLTEEVPEGGKSAYDGYKFRFAPLTDGANVANWTGKWNGKPVKTSATLMGFVTSGFPHTVEFFAPDADMNTAEPEFVVPFVIGIPEIDIRFGGGPSLDELAGTYTGTVALTAMRVTEEMYQLYLNEGLGSDFGNIDLEINSKADCDAALAQYIDQISLVQELTVAKTGENTCTVSGAIAAEQNAPMSAPAVYENGKLILTTEEGTTEIEVTENAGVITLNSGKAVFLMVYEEDGVRESLLVEAQVNVTKQQ